MEWIQEKYGTYKSAIRDLPKAAKVLATNPLEDHKVFYYYGALLATFSHLHTQSYATLSISTLLLPYISVPKYNLALILSVLSHQHYGVLEYTPLIFMIAGLSMTLKGGQVERFFSMARNASTQEDLLKLINTLFSNPGSLEKLKTPPQLHAS